MTDNMKQKALELYDAPFTYEHGYIFDEKHKMVADDHVTENGNMARVRGWGRISYMDNAEQLQDAVGALIAQALTEYWERHK